MKRKIIFGVLVFISIVIISLAIENKNLKESKNMGTKVTMVGNMLASYEYIDRSISVDYFYNLDVNTTYEKIENEIGKPNGAIGSGIIIPYYKVEDQYVVIWFASDEDGTYTNILKMRLYTSDTYIEDIPLKE